MQVLVVNEHVKSVKNHIQSAEYSTEKVDLTDQHHFLLCGQNFGSLNSTNFCDCVFAMKGISLLEVKNHMLLRYVHGIICLNNLCDGLQTCS